MAIKISDQYVAAVAPTTNYPGGSFKNRSSPSATDGTPLEAAWANDLYGFGEALLLAAGVAHSGAPDNAVASDRLNALKKIIANTIHPVGSIVHLAVSTDPATLFGIGTWARIGTGLTIVDSGTGYPAGTTVGEATHTLTVPEMPSHTHGYTKIILNTIGFGGAGAGGTMIDVTSSTGGGGAHNNIPPSFCGYIWQRTA